MMSSAAAEDSISAEIKTTPKPGPTNGDPIKRAKEIDRRLAEHRSSRSKALLATHSNPSATSEKSKPQETDRRANQECAMKEMLGGCCVCSDERGWTENPLVYCDGQGCTVAVHQACYGIVNVPSGPWFCRKCESQERAARVRCELCPSKDGALKRTDNGGWAHVVCALYIPEIRFENVATMEPIVLSIVPPDRYNKSCYICESQGRESKAKIGACMNCNKPGCKHHFHVTCAQAQGLLCEEAGNYQDNVKYCGYCRHHYSKLKKGANLKTIPAFKPLPTANAASDAPSEKSGVSKAGGSGWADMAGSGGVNGSKDKKRKKPGRKSSSNAGSSRESSSSVILETSASAEDSKKQSKSDASPFANILAGVGLAPKQVISDTAGDKNDASETVNSEVSGTAEPAKTTGSKKNDRIGDAPKLPSNFVGLSSPSATEITPAPSTAKKGRTASRKGSTRSATPTSVCGNDTESTLSNVSDLGYAGASEANVNDHTSKPPLGLKREPSTETDISSATQSVIVSSAGVVQTQAPSIQAHSSMLEPAQRTVTHEANDVSVSGPAAGGSGGQGRLGYSSAMYRHNIKEPNESVAAPVPPTKKPRRGRTPKALPVAPDSPPSSPDSGREGGGEQSAKRRKKTSKSTHLTESAAPPTQAPTFPLEPNHLPAPPPSVSTEPLVSSHSNHRDAIPAVPESVPSRDPLASFRPVANHPALSSVPSVSLKDQASQLRRVDSPGSSVTKEQVPQYSQVYVRNGMSAPQMLGNQLNPASSVAQKMSEALSAEVEVHTNFSHPSPSNSGAAAITGVPFPSRNVSAMLNTIGATVSATANAPFPHSLEQLLERQWEQGSQFLMEQAQHYDIASLLSCLHSLRQENMRLEDHVASLHRRRDHLLAVNARLSVPLTVQPNQMAFTGNSGNPSDRTVPGPHAGHSLHVSPQERNSRGTPYLPPIENGMGMTEHISAMMGSSFSSPLNSHRSSVGSSHAGERVIPSPVIVSSRVNSVYHPAPTAGPMSLPPTMSPVQGSAGFTVESRSLTVLRSPSSTPEMRPEMARNTATPSQLHLLQQQHQQQQQQHYAHQLVSPPPSASSSHPTHHVSSHLMSSPAVPSHQHSLSARRDMQDHRHHPLGRPSPVERR